MGYTYRRLLSEKQFLNVQARARVLMRDGTDLSAIYYRDKNLIFKTRSATNRRIIWTQTLHLESVTPEEIRSAKDFRDVELMIQNAQLKVHCNCQAFHYWGYKYMAWKNGYGLERETRAPTIRNRGEHGFLCKHLFLVVQVYPFWSKALAKKFSDKVNISDSTPSIRSQRFNRYR